MEIFYVFIEPTRFFRATTFPPINITYKFMYPYTESLPDFHQASHLFSRSFQNKKKKIWALHVSSMVKNKSREYFSTGKTDQWNWKARSTAKMLLWRAAVWAWKMEKQKWRREKLGGQPLPNTDRIFFWKLSLWRFITVHKIKWEKITTKVQPSV